MSTSQAHVSVDLERLINSLANTDLTDCICEAVVNSIQADATKVTVAVSKADVVIKDNGVGLNRENWESIQKINTRYKQKMNCRGIGRLKYAKLFEIIEMDSFYKDEDQLIRQRRFQLFKDYKTDFDFTDDKVSDESAKTGLTITLKNFRKQNMFREHLEEKSFQKTEHSLRCELSIQKILNPEKDFDVEVLFNGEDAKLFTIRSEDVKKLKEKEVKVNDNDTLRLNYKIEKAKVEGHPFHSMMLVSEGRAVERFQRAGLNIYSEGLLKNYDCIILLSGDILDVSVNPERTAIRFINEDRQNDQKVFSQMKMPTKEEIFEKVREALAKIFRRLPEFEKCEKENRREISKKPHLKEYLLAYEYGLFSPSELVSQARKREENWFKKQASAFSKANTDEERLKISKEQSARELYRYMDYRKQVIGELEKLIQKGETSEATFQEFLTGNSKKKVAGNVKNTNLWLIDDRFNFYNHCLEEHPFKDLGKKLEKLLPSDHPIMESWLAEKKPDIFLYRVEDEVLKVLVLELKPIKIKNKNVDYDRFNSGASYYARAVHELFPNAEKTFYGIGGIDDEGVDRLKTNDWKKVYMAGESRLWKYLPNYDANWFLYSVSSVVNEAKVRHKIFFDIMLGSTAPTPFE